MPRTIEIVVDTKGATVIETKGFEGGSCKDATRRLQAALGATTDDKNTADFYKVENNEQQKETF
jgi:hypothetical protein